MRAWWRKGGIALCAGIFGIAVWGCGDGEEGTTTGLTCGSGTHASGGKCVPNATSDGGIDTSLSCGPGTKEVNGVCVADGSEAGTVTCGPGTHLDEGACVPDDAGTVDVEPQKYPVGAACETAADCETNFCATTALNPRMVGGYCTMLGCGENSPCPAGATCVATSGLMACFAHCDPGADVCRDGYVCQPLSTDPLAGICAPKCTVDADCPAGGVCETTSGMCVPPSSCDPAAPSCPTGSVCFPTSVSPTGGYCFVGCEDPDGCKDSEVCQPMGAGSPDGVCVPPPCAANAQCPAGATCEEQHDALSYCRPPDVCPTGTCTEADTTCVGGLCLSSCSEGAAGDTECSTLHPGLACADSFGACMPACGPGGTCGVGSSCFDTDNVCLPTGSFPGSPCRPDDATHTDPWCLPVGPIEQECYTSGGASFCVPTCSADAECEAVSSALTCVESQGLCVRKCEPGTLACDDGYACETNNMACLPAGAFPGSPCGEGVACATNFDGMGSNLKCLGGSCLIDCATGGDTLCVALGTALGTALTCEEKSLDACVPPCGDAPGFACPSVGGSSLSCFDAFGEKACLPTGAFPGSPCRTTAGDECDLDLGGADAYDLACFESSTSASGTCLLTCHEDTDCSTFNAALSCYEDRGACFQACTTHAECGYPTTGMACLVSEGVCLPAGAFPGGPCNASNLCDPLGSLTQTCVNGSCVVDCNDLQPQTGDLLCQAVNAGLTCMPTNSATGAGSCVFACVGGLCPTGYSCLEPAGTKTGAQNACLPNGAFPGSACAGNACGTYGTIAMTCANNTCVVPCDTDANCTPVGLTCVEASHVCVQPCGAGSTCADNRYACLESQNACLPKGSFPGSPCAEGSNCGSYGALAMACVSGTCLVSCSDAAGGDTICPAVNAALTCDDIYTQACVIACQSGVCPPGMSCAPGNACLPTGSYPGGPCRVAEPRCDTALGGNVEHNLVCAGSACLVDCSWNADVCDDFTGLTCQVAGAGFACLP